MHGVIQIAKGRYARMLETCAAAAKITEMRKVPGNCNYDRALDVLAEASDTLTELGPPIGVK